mmetsp:Transcript_273/g.335  ORF Transcript_273/g.335 Transcript_273/m.335 type:complete len:100 (-) Transcript_273:202-501(-)
MRMEQNAAIIRCTIISLREYRDIRGMTVSAGTSWMTWLNLVLYLQSVKRRDMHTHVYNYVPMCSSTHKQKLGIKSTNRCNDTNGNHIVIILIVPTKKRW